ncbi:MAG: hypothetical protein ACREI7_14060 [Myxococcota bacterium]
MIAARVHSAPCERRELAAGSFSLLEICTCGSVHVTIGAVTLRIQADAFAELATVFDEGARELSFQQVIAEHQSLRRRVVS